MKTIINELTAMIQVRANKIEFAENLNRGLSPKLNIDILNKEIDTLNIAIKAIQQEGNIRSITSL